MRCYMNLLAFDSLPSTSTAPGGTREEQFTGIRDAGFAGVQFAQTATREELALCQSLGLALAGSGRVNTPEEALPLAETLAAEGQECATLHVGWGIESDDEAFRLIESILEASTRLPLYVETHRATIFQDMWRTVEFIRRFPELRFNADFSHWYAGQEMVYGGFEKKLAFIAPVIERVRFIHGRIADPGCIQVPVREGTHFEAMWTACFRACRDIRFAPELLSPGINYARSLNGVELTDRWQESLLLNEIARRCFQQAN